MIDGEQKIIERAVRGESSAFGELYDHYHPKIYRFVLFKVSQREEAEDLTHEIFISAWQSMRTYRDFGFPFSSWLYQIARNRIIDHYRTKKPQTPLEEMDPEYFVAPAMAPVMLEGKMEMERVRKALSRLKTEYQDVVIMRFIEELSLKETAAALGKTEGAVKLMQHRAMKALQGLMA